MRLVDLLWEWRFPLANDLRLAVLLHPAATGTHRAAVASTVRIGRFAGVLGFATAAVLHGRSLRIASFVGSRLNFALHVHFRIPRVLRVANFENARRYCEG